VRLIDADALVNVVETARKKARTLTGMDFVMVTKDAPTIPAIPVEWLQDQCKVFDSMARGGHHSAWIIKALIQQWQEEQEART